MTELKAEVEKQPLLHWLLKRFPETPKTRAKQWIAAGRVSVGGQIARKPHELMPDPGAALQLRDRQTTSLDLAGEWQIHPRVSILYLDGALGIVNKGSSIISVPSGDGAISALSVLGDFLAGRLKTAHRGPGGATLPAAYKKLKPLPVHRLDQYTSGVFCLAMNAEARRRLIDQLNSHGIQRQYVAFVQGHPAAKTGTWRNWLQLNADETRQEIVASKAGARGGSPPQEAVTHFEVVEEFATVTKLRLRLETGRKHQIRAQAAHAGLPLIGDRAYNANYAPNARVAGVLPFDRQALHAESLGLEHPQQAGRRMTWTAPLPRDLRQLEAELRRAKLAGR